MAAYGATSSFGGGQANDRFPPKAVIRWGWYYAEWGRLSAKQDRGR